MAKKTEDHTVAATEELSGAFGFFRKYQKHILYTAGLFALVSFSITGALLGFFDYLFAERAQLPTIEVRGRQVELTQEDYDFGRVIGQGRYFPAVVLPDFDAGGRDERAEAIAILRRAAIAEGLEVSDLEVDAAIEYARAALGVESAVEVALQRGMGSLEGYRQVVKEAMRVGNYMRLQALAADTSDPALVEAVLEDREKITLRAAYFDEQALQDELAEGEVTEEQLREFLDGMSEGDKNRYGVYDTNHVTLQVAAVHYDQFDPAQWEEQLADLDAGTEDAPDAQDEPLRALYEQVKDVFFKVDPKEWEAQDKPLPAPTHFAFEEPEVQQKLKSIRQAEHVLNALWREVRAARDEVLQPLLDTLRTANQEKANAQVALDEARQKAEAEPENEELQAAVTAAEEALETATQAVTDAEQAVEEARTGFDMDAAFREALGEDKTGFVVTTLDGPRNAEDLKDLGELGTWDNPYSATAINLLGELSSRASRTEEVAFQFKVVELVERPMKPFEELVDTLEDAYWNQKAQEQAEEKKEAMQDTLLRLAKEKIAEKIAELEGGKADEIDERLTEWRSGLQEEKSRLEKELEKLRPGSQAHRSYQQRVQNIADELALEDEKREEIETQVTEEIDSEIEEAAREHYHELLDQAAQEVGFTVETFGPYDRQLSSQPRFQHRYDEHVRFLWTNAETRALEEDETSQMVTDFSTRRHYVATCEQVVPMTLEDLTRREIEQWRRMRQFAEQRVAQALRQSFTLNALKKRYRYETPQKEEITAPPGSAPSGQ